MYICQCFEREGLISITIAIVGPCKSGKTSQSKALQALGYAARNVAQEHSFVPTLWQRKGMPDLLVFLDVSYENTLKRSTLRWIESDYERQLVRLKNAREHADLVIDTNVLSQEEVLHVILDAIKKLEEA